MEKILKKIILAAAKAKSHRPEKIIKALENDVTQGDEEALKVMALVIGAMANSANSEEDDVVILAAKELARRMRYAASQQQNK